MKIFYLSSEGLQSSVYISQVKSVVDRLNEYQGIDVDTLVFQSVRSFLNNYKKYGLFLNALLDKKVHIIFFNHLNVFKNFAIFKKRLPEDIWNANILHCRNPEAAYIGHFLLRKKTIYDVRGMPESEHFHNNYQRSKYFSEINRKLFTQDNLFYSFVCKQLKSYYEDKYRVTLSNYIIAPSVYNDNVFSINYNRRERVDDKIIRIVYSGGTQFYQNIDRIVCFLEKLSKSNNKLLRLYLLINSSSRLKVKSNILKITIRYSLKQKELGKMCKTCDYGIIYRHNTDYNLVSTPTKVAEYLGSGLKVLAVGNAGSYTEIIKNNPKLGYVFRDEDESLQLSKPSMDDKTYCHKWAKSNLSLSCNIMKYKEFYEKIIE